MIWNSMYDIYLAKLHVVMNRASKEPKEQMPMSCCNTTAKTG